MGLAGRVKSRSYILCAAVLFGAVLFSSNATGQPALEEEREIAVSSEVEIFRILERAAESSATVRFLMVSFSSLILLGILIDVVFLFRWGARRRAIEPRRLPVGWGLWDVAKVILVFLMAVFAFQMLFPVIRICCVGVSDVFLVVSLQFFAEIIAIFFIFQLLPVKRGGALRELKLVRRNVFGDIYTGVKGYIGFLPVLLMLVWVTELVAGRAGIELKPQEQIGFFFMDMSFPSLVFLICFVAFLGPVFEEIFFRGFAYQALRNRWGRWPSILLTALLFSALHASFSVFLPILGLGVLLAYVFETSGSLVPSITIHICQNSVAVMGAMLIRSFS